MKKRRIFRLTTALISVAVCLGACFGLVGPAAAASAPSSASSGTSSAPVDQNLAGLAGAVAAMGKTPSAPTTARPKLPAADHVTDFTWTGAQTLQGLYSTSDLYFTLPSYWDTRYACILIDYDLSSLIKGAPSSLTFSLNGQPFYSCSVAYKNGETQTLYVQIPQKLLKDDRQSAANYLEVTGYARLDNSQGCVDDDTDAGWITLDTNSGVEVGYNLKPYDNKISYYPYPYLSSLTPSGAGTAVEFAAGQDDEVAAAMFLEAHLSGSTGQKDDLAVGTYADLEPKNYQNRILFAVSSDLPSGLKAYAAPYSGQLKNQVLIKSVTTSGGPLLLIVSDDPSCLMEASSFLSDTDRVSEADSDHLLIKKGTAKTMADAKKQNSMNVNQYTLQGVTGGGLDFIGPFHQTKTVFLPVPADYTLSASSKISLKFRYSGNLDFTRSMVTVYWGSVPLESKKLTAAGADGDELTFSVPPDVVGTAAGTIQIAFDLEIPDLVCTPREDQMPWAYVTPDSTFYLPPNNDVPLQFDDRPAPFQKDGSLDNVLLVLPDRPTADEYTLLGRATALYGAGSDAYGSLAVKKASEFSPGGSDYNIITAGTPADNSFIAKLNGSLFFQYNKAGTQFMTNSKLILTDEYAKSIGTLQLLQSPYSAKRGILVLTGPSDASLGQISAVLADQKAQWGLKNDCVLVDPDGNLKTYRFKSVALGQNKANLGQAIANNKTSLLFALAGTSIMLILFLAAVLIFLRSRTDKKR